jgi:hypothetical protein
MRQNDEFSYKPLTNKPNMDAIFKQEKSVHYDANARMFCERLENARKEEDDKKKRVYGDLSKVSEKKWAKSGAHRSASAENTSQFYVATISNSSMMNVMKRNLHEELHSIYLHNELLNNEEY